jgi:hypothetical protein
MRVSTEQKKDFWPDFFKIRHEPEPVDLVLADLPGLLIAGKAAWREAAVTRPVPRISAPASLLSLNHLPLPSPAAGTPTDPGD